MANVTVEQLQAAPSIEAAADLLIADGVDPTYALEWAALQRGATDNEAYASIDDIPDDAA